MDSDAEEITTWLLKLKGGNDEAERILWEQVFDRLVRMARRKLEAQGLERRTRDEEDIALSAIKSFFGQARDGHLPELENRIHMWKLLASFTHRKILDKRKYDSAQKRGGGEQLTISESDFESNDVNAWDTTFSQSPSPEFVIMMNEAIEGLPIDLKTVAVLALEGLNQHESANRIGVSSKTIRRRLDALEALWTGDR